MNLIKLAILGCSLLAANCYATPFYIGYDLQHKFVNANVHSDYTINKNALKHTPHIGYHVFENIALELGYQYAVPSDHLDRISFTTNGFSAAALLKANISETVKVFGGIGVFNARIKVEDYSCKEGKFIKYKLAPTLKFGLEMPIDPSITFRLIGELENYNKSLNDGYIKCKNTFTIGGGVRYNF